MMRLGIPDMAKGHQDKFELSFVANVMPLPLRSSSHDGSGDRDVKNVLFLSSDLHKPLMSRQLNHLESANLSFGSYSGQALTEELT
jgi:hypothetical protein